MAVVVKRWIWQSMDRYWVVLSGTHDLYMGAFDRNCARAEKLCEHHIENDSGVGIDDVREWLEFNSAENSLYLSDMPKDLRRLVFSDITLSNICECGGLKNNWPHSHWCPMSYTNRKM